MIQMLPKLHIPMSPRSNMKIPLHLIPLQAPKNPTSLRLHPPLHPRRLLKLPFLTPHLPQYMSHMCILLLLLQSLATLQFMHPALHINPLLPRRGISLQHITSEDPVATGILDVDVEVGTLHGHDNVKVYLEIVGDAFFDGEEVGFMAGVPSTEFGEGQNSGYYEE